MGKRGKEEKDRDGGYRRREDDSAREDRDLAPCAETPRVDNTNVKAIR